MRCDAMPTSPARRRMGAGRVRGGGQGEEQARGPYEAGCKACVTLGTPAGAWLTLACGQCTTAEKSSTAQEAQPRQDGRPDLLCLPLSLSNSTRVH